MSTYVMSDLHGCKEEFDAMLETIQYSTECDEMWILGDICDRGKEPIPLLKEIIQEPSMHIIFGNHEIWFEKYAETLIDAKTGSMEMTDELMCWLHNNGGFRTADQFMDLSFPECHDIRLYLEENKKFYQYLTIHGKKYLLIHAGIEKKYLSPTLHLSSVPDHSLAWSHIDIDDNPFEDVTMIVGHTPTFLYGKQYENHIIHSKNNTLFHIDCGCIYGRTLSCIRLDDLNEFYIPSSYPYVLLHHKK